jgi:hypothetical protein
MKYALCFFSIIALHSTSIYAMKMLGGGPEQKKSLKRMSLKSLEEDWKNGGNAASACDLNDSSGWSCTNVFAQALRENKSAAFIEYLLNNGANVSKWVDVNDAGDRSFCFPLALVYSYKSCGGECFNTS